MGTSAPGAQVDRPAPQRAAQELAPQECTLSSVGRHARALEFSETFAETIQRVERPEPTRLRLQLEPSPASAARAAANLAGPR